MKILIADDESVSRRFLQGLLTKWGYEVISAEDGNAAWELLRSPGAPRMALLDWMMPGLNGVEVCREMRRQCAESYTYILLLTAKDAKESIVEGLESGADDYLTKPFHPLELKARIRVGSRLLQLEDNLVQARESMRYKATHDTLTGVWSRGAILEILERELARSQREKAPMGVLIADLDHFKNINDSHGHLAGDAVLREVTRRMESEIRPYDAVGRFGGEEFLILLPGCGSPETAEKAERLRNSIGDRPIETDYGPVNVTISIGAVAVGDSPADSANRILHLADAALYRAKEQGRNRSVLAGAADYAATDESSLELFPQDREKS